MDADRSEGTRAPSHLAESVLTDKLLRLFYDVFNELGGGFVESVYAHALAIALTAEGIGFVREPSVPIMFRNTVVGIGRPDLIVAASVIVECKAVRAIEGWHRSQVLHYLRASGLQVALLLNFGPRPEFKRIVLTTGQGGRGSRE